MIDIIHGNHHTPITQKIMKIRQSGYNPLIIMTSIYSNINIRINVLSINKERSICLVYTSFFVKLSVI